MPRATRKPNTQLRNIVLEETNDGRDVVRYLKSVFMQVEDAPRLFGLIPDDYARTHKIAAARILARLGLEEGKRYLRRNYVQTPFKRVHPEDEDGPRKDMAAATSDLYRLVRKETNDGREIILYFVGIMKGYRDGYKPHLRLAAAKELIRHIEFDYDEPASPMPTAPTQTTAPAPPEPIETAAETQPAAAIPAHPVYPINPVSDNPTATNLPDQDNPVYPINLENPASDKITAHPQNHSSDDIAQPKTVARIRPKPPLIRPNTPTSTATRTAESIYRSIIRRSANRPTLDYAKYEGDARMLIQDFNRFAKDCDPKFPTQ